MELAGQETPKVLNLGLNDGTRCPQACIDVLRSFQERTSLRNYTESDNRPLLETIAKVDGVRPEHIYLANGSGPLLKQCIPTLVETAIRSSPSRILRHLVSKTGYPIITGAFTYSKVPLKAAGLGLQVELIPMRPEDGFTLDPALLEATLKKRDGLVYLANPNNPTGNLLIDESALVGLLNRYPSSTFWLDEAYVQYLDPAEHQPMSSLVVDHPNLLVSRTFSFAYGLAGARIGYLLAAPERIEVFIGQVTDYRLGCLQEALAIAALKDTTHLPALREETRRESQRLLAGIRQHAGLEAWDSRANFILCRFTDGRSGADLAEQMLERGIRIKTFTPVKEWDYTPYFRVTLGVPEENTFFLEELAALA